jgi:hypothetical protein
MILWILAGVGVLLGAVLLAIVIRPKALLFPCHRVVEYYKAMAILILNALLLCAGLELAARTTFNIKSLFSKPAEDLVGEGKPRETVSYYSSQDWAKRYWYEFRLSSKQQYYPHVGWRRAPFKGQTINVAQNGVRLTPGADCSEKSFKVFVFGESTMWGTGSPDWATIPANLQRLLGKKIQGPVCVVNFAESAYVLTQNLITLLVELQSGNRPDLAVFYNVEGDAYSGYQAGKAGVIQNLDQVAAKFEKSERPLSFLNRLESTASYSLIGQLVGKLTVANLGQEESTSNQLVTYETMGKDFKELSNSIAQNYFRDYQIVDALSEKGGFKYFFLLPPHLLLESNKPLTHEEQEMRRQAESDSAFKKLLTAVYQNIQSHISAYPNIYSITDVFDKYDSSIWIDAGHVTPVGNQLIADRILNIIQARSSDKK